MLFATKKNEAQIRVVNIYMGKTLSCKLCNSTFRKVRKRNSARKRDEKKKNKRERNKEYCIRKKTRRTGEQRQ